MEKYIKETKMDLEKLIRENIKTMQAYSSARDEFQDVEQKMMRMKIRTKTALIVIQIRNKKRLKNYFLKSKKYLKIKYC